MSEMEYVPADRLLISYGRVIPDIDPETGPVQVRSPLPFDPTVTIPVDVPQVVGPVDEETLMVGLELTVTKTASVFVQPFASVPVTV